MYSNLERPPIPNFHWVHPHQRRYAVPPSIASLNTLDTQRETAVQGIIALLESRPALFLDEQKPENYELLKRHHDPMNLERVLKDIFNCDSLLNNQLVSAQEIFHAIVSSHTPHIHGATLLFLQSTTVFSESSIKTILQNPCLSHFIVITLKTMQSSGLLDGDNAQENFNLMVNSKTLAGLYSAMLLLQDTDVLSGEMGQLVFSTLSHHIYPENVARAFVDLSLKGKLAHNRLRNICCGVLGKYTNLTIVNNVIALLLQTDCDVASFKRFLNSICSSSAPDQVLTSLTELLSIGLFDLSMVDFVVMHANPLVVSNAMIQLKLSGVLLTHECTLHYFNIIARSQFPAGMAHALIYLIRKEYKPLTDALFIGTMDYIAMHPDPNNAARGVDHLFTNGLLSSELAQASLQLVLTNPHPLAAAQLLTFLSKAKLLHLTRFDVLASCQNIATVHSIFKRLQSIKFFKNIYATQCLNCLFSHQNPRELEAILKISITNKLIVDSRDCKLFEVLLQHHDLISLQSIFRMLSQYQILTHAYVDDLIQYSAILFDGTDCWSRIPLYLFSENRFIEILNICRENHDDIVMGRRRFHDYIDRLLNIQQRENAFNPLQSTHTTSVHRSASESAIRLYERYQNIIEDKQVDTIVKKLYAELFHVSKHPLCIVADRCITRFKADGVTTAFIDPLSRISVQTMLALFYLAINDEEHRTGTLDDGYSCLIEGLYEIQRDGNLSKDRIDNGHVTDLFICPSGTFNKFIEKLVGIHPDAQMSYVTKSGLSLKYTVVIKEELIEYLKQLPDPIDAQECADRLELLDSLEDEIPMDVWMAISERIADRIFDEFGSLYPNRHAPAFQELINSGHSFRLTLEQLTEFRELIPLMGAAQSTKP